MGVFGLSYLDTLVLTKTPMLAHSEGRLSCLPIS